MRLRPATLPLLALAVSAVACGIPDLKPFSDATAAMATGLKLGFERTQAVLANAAATADDQDAFAKQVQALNARWTPTKKALSAIVAYADALTSLAEAGKNGAETMAVLTDRLSDLSSAVGALPLAGTAATVIQKVGAQIIAMRAGQDIRRAVRQAADAIDLLAPLLRDNFADLARIHEAAANAWASRVEGRWSRVVGYHQTLSAEVERLYHLLTLIIDYQSAPARLRLRAAEARARGDLELAARLEASIPQEQQDVLAALKAADSAFAAIDLSGADAAARVEARQLHLMGLIDGHRQELAALQASHERAETDHASVESARTSGARILDKGGEAIDAWRKAHASLALAVEGRQSRPTVAELLAAVQEIAALAAR
jgi:hypothetical protein